MPRAFDAACGEQSALDQKHVNSYTHSPTPEMGTPSHRGELEWSVREAGMETEYHACSNQSEKIHMLTVLLLRGEPRAMEANWSGVYARLESKRSIAPASIKVRRKP